MSRARASCPEREVARGHRRGEVIIMKTAIPWILTVLLAAALVVVVAARPATAPVAQKKILYWVDPMHPAYKSDKPGKAPDCGMDLVPVYEGGAAPAGDGRISIPPAQQQLIGVQTGRAEVRPLGRSVRTVGRV